MNVLIYNFPHGNFEFYSKIAIMLTRKLLNSSPKNILLYSACKPETIIRNGSSALSSMSGPTLIKDSGVKQIKCSKLISNNVRTLQTTASRCNYEGDGKTTLTDIADDIGKYVIVQSLNEFGFGLSNQGFCVGSLILFPNVYLSWRVKTIEDITEESLTVFKVIEPKLDLLVLGIGRPNEYTSTQIRDLRARVKNTGLNVEIQSTKSAIGTYNYMLSDLRVVAGAFLVPKSDLQRDLERIPSSKQEDPVKIEEK